ncbi:MAG: hypothetical protein ABI551_09485 [Polyangiaceae bacterium]
MRAHGAMLSAATLLGAALSLSACSKKADDAGCRAMLDRYLELSMAPDPEIARLSPTQAEDLVTAKKLERRADPAYKAALRRCKSEVSRRELDCAMAAPTANDWEACLD